MINAEGTKIIVIVGIGIVILFIIIYWLITSSPLSKLDDAMKNNDLEKAKEVIKEIKNPNQRLLLKFNLYTTYLIEAVKYHNPNVAELLINSGAEVNQKSHMYLAPIDYAALTGDSEMVKTLIKMGANVNNSKEGPYSNPKLIAEQAVLDNITPAYSPFSWETKNISGSISLYIATLEASNPGLYQELRRYDLEDPWALDAGKIYLGDKRSTKIVKMLLDAGADPSTMAEDKSLLHYLAEDHYKNSNKSIADLDYEIMKILIEYNANKNIKDDDGKTPLDYATKNNDKKMIELLNK